MIKTLIKKIIRLIKSLIKKIIYLSNSPIRLKIRISKARKRLGIRKLYMSKKPKWDPSWGWDNQIYYLGSENKDFREFFNWPCALYLDGKIAFKLKKAKLCAGCFVDKLYFGSQSKRK